MKTKITGVLLYAIAFFILSYVAMSFVNQYWSWGLMDDVKFLTLPGTIEQRAGDLFKSMIGHGRFQPFYNLYAASFYKFFEHSPKLFYLVHALIVALTLAAWGYLSFLFTARWIAFPLFLCVSLSFYKFYDAFFYLSDQEILGLLLAGIASIFMFRAFAAVIGQGKSISWFNGCAALFFLIGSFCAKETFLVIGMAWGLSLIISGLKNGKSRQLISWGIALLAGSLLYGFALKHFVVTEYSSAYSFSDFAKIWWNITNWFQVDLVGHAPWLAVGFLLMVFRAFTWVKTPLRVWGLIVAGLFYAGYVVVLLPWQTLGHYTIPLAVLFAFFFAVLMADAFEQLNTVVAYICGAAILVLNLYVCSSAFTFMSTYQQDTDSLIKWAANNAQFQYELNTGANVRANACEPAERIPELVKYYYQKNMSAFIFTTGVRDIMADPKTVYFLYGTTWGDQDLSRLPNLWYPVFVSKSWVMFRRLY